MFRYDKLTDGTGPCSGRLAGSHWIHSQEHPKHSTMVDKMYEILLILFYNIIKMEELTRHIFVYEMMYSTFTMETYFAVSLTPQFR